MQKRRFTALIAGLAASAALGFSMPATAQQYKDEYKLSTVLGEAFPWGWGAKRWADLVAEKTEGRIKIKVYPGTSLVSGDQTKEFTALRQGIIDMAVGSTINWSPQVKELNLFALPFLMPDHKAIDALTQAIKMARSGLGNPGKPIGSFLFLGPSGVGKTELAKAVAEFMFGDENKMIRIDMSEYGDGTVGIEKLIGMPRGIVGSERGGILTEQLRDNPYTVLLLDEVEKANPYLMNIFLQAFDEGWITDGRGKKVYLSDAIVIMTSNLGSENFKKYEKPLGFGTKSLGDVMAIKGDVMKAAETRFTPEFRNRIDEIVVFSPLTMDEVREIARLYLGKVKRNMERQGKFVEITEAAVDALTEKGFSPAYGARFLKRHIDQKVKLPITNLWKSAIRFMVDAKDGEVIVSPNDSFNLN